MEKKFHKKTFTEEVLEVDNIARELQFLKNEFEKIRQMVINRRYDLLNEYIK